MIAFRRSRASHLLACLLALCLGLFSTESLIADVHDGDAPAVAVLALSAAAVSPGHDATSPTAPQATAGVSVTPGGGEWALALAPQPSVDGSTHGTPSEAPTHSLPGHGAHVCHDLHTHVAALPAVIALPALVMHSTGTAPRTMVDTAMSRTREPQLRPPIV